jgi:hypothetical protein
VKRKQSQAGLIFTILLLAANAPVYGAGLEVVTPVGGEVFVVGQQQRVKINGNSKYRSFTVELSRDGGVTFTLIGKLANNKDTKGESKDSTSVLNFTIDGVPSAKCVIRVKA